jgi:serine/threonine protein kinase
MATVYEGVNPTIQRHVAIKVLLPEYAREAEAMNRFINEARAVNVIQHPGIVQVTDYGILPDGAGYIVMECLNGETLTCRLESCGGKLTTSAAVHVAWQLAGTLVTAHAAGIVHRDLKPSNVMLVPDPHMPSGERTKILDFGLAKLVGPHESTQFHTNSNAIVGTPLYMSPEQCQGAGRVDAKTDVYSLGCILYEMLAGRPPFLGTGVGEMIGSIRLSEGTLNRAAR